MSNNNPIEIPAEFREWAKANADEKHECSGDMPDSIIYEAADANEAYIEACEDAYRHLTQSSGTGGWDSKKVIGRVGARFKELITKGWEWHSFYNGWMEGRADMLAVMKGWREELPDEPRLTDLDESPEPAKESQLDTFLEWLDGEIKVHLKKTQPNIVYKLQSVREKYLSLLAQPKPEPPEEGIPMPSDQWFEERRKEIIEKVRLNGRQDDSPSEEKTLGQMLREIREEKGLSENAVKQETGISNEYLRRLEDDVLKRPSASVLWKLSQYYSIDFKPLAIKAGIIIKAPPSPPVKPEREECCNNCKHLQIDNSPDQTGPSIWCSKGHFEGVGSKEEADILSRPIDCKNFRSSRPASPAIQQEDGELPEWEKDYEAVEDDIYDAVISAADAEFKRSAVFSKMRGKISNLQSRLSAVQKERDEYRNLISDISTGFFYVPNELQRQASGLIKKYPQQK